MWKYSLFGYQMKDGSINYTAFKPSSVWLAWMKAVCVKSSFECTDITPVKMIYPVSVDWDPVVPLKNETNNEITPTYFLSRCHLISSVLGLEVFLKLPGDACILMLYIYSRKERWGFAGAHHVCVLLRER